MATNHPGATAHTPVEPLLVRPRKAWKLLDCGNTHGYKLLNDGEIDSFKDGGGRWVVVASIHRYIARKLAAEQRAASESNPADGRASTPIPG